MRENKIESFTDINSWKKVHQLVLSVYKITNTFKEKHQFYSIALGSLTEVQNQLLIAKDLGYISPETFKGIAQETITAGNCFHQFYCAYKFSLKKVFHVYYQILQRKIYF